jgi:hypothetical protein
MPYSLCISVLSSFLPAASQLFIVVIICFGTGDFAFLHARRLFRLGSRIYVPHFLRSLSVRPRAHPIWLADSAQPPLAAQFCSIHSAWLGVPPVSGPLRIRQILALPAAYDKRGTVLMLIIFELSLRFC